MKHIFKPGKDASKPVLLMLHGTGGTEQDLLATCRFNRPGSGGS